MTNELHPVQVAIRDHVATHYDQWRKRAEEPRPTRAGPRYNAAEVATLLAPVLKAVHLMVVEDACETRLFVTPAARGTGVAAALVRAASRVAAEDGRRQLLYWVGTDNGRAVAFASSFGFRPTESRRPMRVVSEDDGEEEVAMTLSLAGDRGGIPSAI